MDVFAEKIEDILVVRLIAKTVDASNVLRIKEQLQHALAPDARTILDFKQLEFIDSSGLGAILSCIRVLRAGGGSLRLANVSKPVRTILEMVRLQKLVKIFDTLDQALDDCCDVLDQPPPPTGELNIPGF